MNAIDTHCHLSHSRLCHDVAGVLARAAAAGVGACICASGDLREAQSSLALARRHVNVFATAGVHPHEAKSFTGETLDALEQLLADPQVVALGEIGLDYFHDLSPRPAQQEAFAAQLHLAQRTGSPIVIHTRDAFDDTMAILRASGTEGSKVIFHSFTEGPDQARAALDFGAAVSFSGIVTFRRSDALRDAAALVPDDRLLLETDAPYLTPEPVRKLSPNEPALIVHTLACLAQLRHADPGALADAAAANAIRLFALPEE
ncbi:MAG: TatD family hydrolase [Planctomycetota bacterium]|nr:TatD family hydrolase [Planctomycetota bacterium]